jgi:6-pyruvoyltetrahydropterin/6-carboxytetrahydropterin synthase
VATMELTRILRFSAAHRLTSAALSPAENERVYGPCARDHGHNYALEATVRGVVDADGMVMDLTVLDRAMWTVVDQVDHRDLTRDVPPLTGVISTGENLAATFYRMIDRQLPRGRLVRVAVVETENNRFEYEATGGAP